MTIGSGRTDDAMQRIIRATAMNPHARRDAAFLRQFVRLLEASLAADYASSPADSPPWVRVETEDRIDRVIADAIDHGMTDDGVVIRGLALTPDKTEVAKTPAMDEVFRPDAEYANYTPLHTGLGVGIVSQHGVVRPVAPDAEGALAHWRFDSETGQLIEVTAPGMRPGERVRLKCRRCGREFDADAGTSDDGCPACT